MSNPEPELDGQLTLYNEPGRTHHNDPWTSHAASRSILRSPQRLNVLRALAAAGEHGATDAELGEQLDIRETASGTRRKELEEAGLCARTARTRPTRYGNQALVHVITQAGLTALQTATV